MKADKLILGENAIFSTDCKKTGVNNNVLVCGGSGSGKTMSLMEPRLLENQNSSMIVTVTKRSLIDRYTNILKEKGYRVLDLNFVNPQEGGIAFDPLDYIKTSQDIIFLAQSIVLANPRKEHSNADPYWDETAVSLLAAEISYVMQKKENPSFGDVLEMQSRLKIKESYSSVNTTLDEEFDELEEEDQENFAVGCWRSFKDLPIKTASCIYGTLNTTIDTVFTSELRKMFSLKEKLDIASVSEEKTTLFISTSPVNPALNCFVNMFYGQVFKTLFEKAQSNPNGKLTIPVQILCDDFATGCKILNFPEYISVFREVLISVTLLIQSETQLAGMYGENNAMTIINNCDTYLYMGGMDLATGRSVSERLNIPIEEVLYMPIGQIYIFRRGQQPIITQRYNIYKNKNYQKYVGEYER